MPPPKSAGFLAAESMCKRFPEYANLTLAKKLFAEHPECYKNLESARTVVRRLRGAMGKGEEKYAVCKQPKRKAGQRKLKCPDSFAEPWVPFELPLGKVGVLADLHLPYHNPVACEAAVKHMKDSGCKIILFNGDYSDFYQVSRHQKDPRKRRLKDERKIAIEGLEWIRGEFPKEKLFFKMGNHEQRWEHYLVEKAPEIWDLEILSIDKFLEFDRLKITLIPGDSPVMAGDLPILHGHELPRGMTSPVNPARGAFLRTHHTVMVSHSHVPSSHSESDLFHKECFCWSTGCLCELTPQYARVNKWAHGASIVDVHSDKSFDVENFRITNKGTIRKS